MLRRVLNYQNKSTLGAAFILAAASLVSRLFGLLRDRLLASHFGASTELDIYYAAFRLPDFIYNILIVGAISASFIPLFAEHFAKDKEKAWQYASNLLNFILLGLTVLSVVLIVFARPIVSLIAPGFDARAFDLTVQLSRIMFLSPLLLGISSIISGILQYFKRFFIYSLAPILYNIGIILGIIFFLPPFGLKGLALGVALGALFHFLIQLFLVRAVGFSWRPVLDIKDKSLWQTLTLMVSRTISSISSQINIWVITALASLLAAGSIAIFNLANNLSYLPIGIFGISLAVAVFPNLAKSEAEKNKEQFFSDFSQGFRLIFLITFPLSFIFYLLRAHIVRVVLGAGEFGWIDTRLTAASVGLFSLSIFAQSLIPFVARAFFAIKDTKTPTILTIIFVITNILLALVFMRIVTANSFLAAFLRIDDLKDIRVIALPLSFALAQILQFVLMLGWLKSKIKLPLKDIAQSAGKVILATIVALPVTYLSLYGAANFLKTDTLLGILSEGLIGGLVGLSIYYFVMILLGSPELKAVKAVISSKFFVKPPSVYTSENGKF